MTSNAKRRASRRKLKAHDRGEDRHNPGLALIKKQNRLVIERQSTITKSQDEEKHPSARPWSRTETEYLLDGHTISEVVEFTGRLRAGVYRKLHKLIQAGIAIPFAADYWSDKETAIANSGLPLDTITEQTGRSRASVLRKLVRLRRDGVPISLADDTAHALAHYDAVDRDWQLTPTERTYLEENQ